MTELLVAEVTVVGDPILIQQHRHLDQCSVTAVRAEELSCVTGGPAAHNYVVNSAVPRI